ncbi:MAG TPA: hypothetical protein VHL31_25140 [Geminicoccus sp.]|jgi:hypothetical protein|nr:hypothetical protein [Geminicoccus sp.]HEX2529566.1 hypothetical protein [Geminicoccus sp.]
MMALPELVAHRRPDGDRHVLRLTVWNEAGRPICRATLDGGGGMAHATEAELAMTVHPRILIASRNDTSPPTI